MKSIVAKDYKIFLHQIKQRVHQAQYDALKAVNKELIGLYWDIGRMIVQQQKRHGWGRSVVENLALDLQSEFPGMQGFSVSGLWRMRNFYLAYRRDEKLAPLVREIGWSHNMIIVEKCKDSLEREFYIRMARKFGWSKNVLIHQIEGEAYAKTLLNQTNFHKALPPEIRRPAKLAVKDEYTFDFLELGEEHSEKQLERELLTRMDRFLRAMGGAMAFVGSQYRLEVGGKEYFIDILLYHRYLRCLVALELKTGEFAPEYVGKMQFYLTALDRHVRGREENPPVGIIVCKSKNKTVVEYALQEARKPVGVATYRLTRTLPARLQKELPAPEHVAKLLGGI